MPKAKLTKSESKTEISKKPVWLKHTDKDIEAIIVKLAKQGLTSEKIGLILRDSYGIPKTKLYGKSISKILRERGTYSDAALSNLEKKQKRIKKHLEKNKQDKRTKRALTIINTRIKKLKEHKKREAK